MPEDQENETSEDSNAKEDIYIGPKSRPKIVRVLTVLAYVLSVSMAAILLSVYYIFMWDGHPTLASRKANPQFEDFQSDVYNDKMLQLYNHTFPNNNKTNFTDVEFDGWLKKLLLFGDGAEEMEKINRSLQGQIIGRNYSHASGSIAKQIVIDDENLKENVYQNFTNTTKAAPTLIKAKQILPPSSTTSYEESTLTTTTIEDAVDVNTVTAVLPTSDFSELSRSLLYKRLFLKKLLK